MELKFLDQNLPEMPCGFNFFFHIWFNNTSERHPLLTSSLFYPQLSRNIFLFLKEENWDADIGEKEKIDMAKLEQGWGTSPKIMKIKRVRVHECKSLIQTLFPSMDLPVTVAVKPKEDSMLEPL